MANNKPKGRPSPPTVPGKPTPEKEPPPAAPAESTAQPVRPSKTLELPRGAMLVMRVSGGINFTTQEMAVYPDGRVTHGAGDTSRKAYERPSRTLNDAQVMRLRRLLDQSGFFRMKAKPADQSPDSYAYEILARLGTKSNRLEVFTGGIPDGIQALVDFLMRWMPEEPAASEASE